MLHIETNRNMMNWIFRICFEKPNYAAISCSVGYIPSDCMKCIPRIWNHFAV